MKAQYNEAQLKAAAYFLSTFNEYVISFDDIYDDMISCIEKYGEEEETNTVACAGYHINFLRNEQPGVVEVEIFVDPTIMFCGDEEDFNLVYYEL